MSSFEAISIAICTYNRCQQLRLTLPSLANCSGSLVAQDEILVIDNNCSDDTVQVIQEFTSVLPLRRVVATDQGLSAARNVALQEFTNPHLIFIDDDINFTLDSLHAYRQAIQDYPDDDFFGGRIKVDWQGDKPQWLRDDGMPLISGLIGHYDMRDDGLAYTVDSLLPYGANFILSRKLVLSVGKFDTQLGVKGKGIGRGEETDYLQRAMQQGFSGRYLANALVWHRFQSERLTTAYLYSYGREKAGPEVVQQPAARRYMSAFTWFSRGIWQFLKGRRDRYYQSVINAGIVIGRKST